MDTFLNSYKEQEGGPLRNVFDKKKAEDILDKYLPILSRVKQCSCDTYCPHKSDISRLGLLCLNQQLDNCLKPTRGFLEAFQDIKRNSVGDILEIPQNVSIGIVDSDIPEHSIHNNTFNPGLKKNNYYKVKLIGRRDKVKKCEIIPRSFIEIMEGIEIFDKKVKSIIVNFNDISFFTFTVKEDKTYYEFLFPIILKCLQFVLVDIVFLNEEKVQIFPEYSLIGGYYNGLNLAFNYLGKKYEAKYIGGAFSIDPYVQINL